MDKDDNKPIRNFIARDELQKRRSKKFADRRDRRSKDARKSWKNEEH